MKRFLPSVMLMCITASLFAQRPATPANGKDSSLQKPPNGVAAPVRKEGPKPYKEVITDKAVTKRGLFTVHKVDDKWYFEIADTILDREILAVTRYSKTPAGGNNYGGERVNEQTIRFERGPSNNVFMRVLTIVSIAADSTEPISQAVTNSNLNPIAAAFDIKAFGHDSASVVIDVSEFFKGDNQAVSLSPSIKRRYNLGGLASDRSYIQSVHTFPMNTEVRSVKTYSSTPSGGFTLTLGPQSSTTLPAADAAGAVTLELNNSFVLLPKVPMRRRLFDPRVGFFASEFDVYGDNQQRVKTTTFIHHWRLEPKEEDVEKWKRGELVEPKKQIIYYIDPATPKKWRPYLISGINDWQKAFEKAGFKNAIVGKEWPEHDSTMSLEDARFSVIRYFASDIENAYGPNEADPRSGEILESHIGWYHNVMKLLHDWYFIQTAAVDPRARKMVFDDSLMGTLVRFVSSHEVGHTLGLRHNMGSSSKTPVEKLRDKNWVEAHGHTASIMDYARFNYVAQPEDNISPMGLYPHIGEYDNWAIQWGYRPILNTKDEEEDNKILNKLVIDSLASNPRLWFGGEGFGFDPRSQTEDLGDNSVKASEYGVRNLKKILAHLPEWTKEEADRYDNLEEMYSQLVSQFQRYMFHVTRNVGGIYETLKSVEEKGDVYEATPKAIQKDAVQFLNHQVFETPAWMLDKNILNKFSTPAMTDNVGSMQTNVLNSIMSGGRLYRLAATQTRYGTANSYGADDLLDDLKKGVWGELASHKAIDPYRRTLQKTYIDNLANMVNTPAAGGFPSNIPREFIALFFVGNARTSDVPSIARAQLNVLKNEITSAIPAMTDKMSRYHLQDVLERIKLALNPPKQ